ncbi:hypothetical protein DW701_10230 [Bacteroides eggerthii]|uniref:Uncharacterized protein n=1 Tax=Bacteroides eggerthii TaxID=28111 RepID=A0A415RXL2_9BACE|nr:hypothetical protein F2Z23_11860 [Bacteroides eggerthii]KAA5281922.1 hypothetical protein F2Z10_16685 [Bacteroides eggerthii]MBT9882926.1 hypothetical protein [Bacteroides eggerthii]RHB00963.1 hypothetical protein DW910_02195 [Bacteroides eggerthii]RHF08716.1 hypothetical protein DW701_10230 [Bacteroides eggerthii]
MANSFTAFSSNIEGNCPFIFKNLLIADKDNANREQNKMNLFIFYAEVRLIFTFDAKIVQIECNSIRST